MIFLQTTDFDEGKYSIARNNFTEDNLQSYIDTYEPEIIKKMLGATLGGLFIANVNGTTHLPTDARFLALYNAFITDDMNAQLIYESKGIKEMVKGYVFFKYNQDSTIQNTMSGSVESTVENAQVLSLLKANIQDKYNAAIDTYNAIQWYISQNLNTYPEYNGQAKRRITLLG